MQVDDEVEPLELVNLLNLLHLSFSTPPYHSNSILLMLITEPSEPTHQNQNW